MKTNILGSEISVLDLNETCDQIVSFVKEKKTGYVCISNVHTVVTGLEDKEFKKITNEALLATADGVPLLWASKFLEGQPIHGRASGPDILEAFITNPKYKDIKHYFYGSTKEVLLRLENSLKSRSPHFQIVGMDSPPMKRLKSMTDALDPEEAMECDRIRKSKADLIWVGLGAPKQEYWMARTYKFLSEGQISLGVGAAFDFHSGNKIRAPLWMQNAGLEWAHRMMSEPTRLASRYLKTNPVFVKEVLKQKLMNK